MSNERRRITWGTDSQDTLEPFVVDYFGQVFHTKTGKLVKSMTRTEAMKTWNQDAGGDRWKTVDLSKTYHVGKRIETMRPEELIRGWSDDLYIDLATGKAERRAEDVTRWLFDDRTSSPIWSDASLPPPRPTVRLQPDEWLSASGDVDTGWVVVRVKNQFNSLFHGPSMAARAFDMPST